MVAFQNLVVASSGTYSAADSWLARQLLAFTFDPVTSHVPGNVICALDPTKFGNDGRFRFCIQLPSQTPPSAVGSAYPLPIGGVGYVLNIIVNKSSRKTSGPSLHSCVETHH